MALPERLIIHVSGIPATGKSTFCRFLAQNHRFAHYDIECFPHGWPQTELWDSWLQNPREFVEELGRHHHRSAIDWGFPVQARSRVAKMKASGVILIWFAGSVRYARKIFIERGEPDVAVFDQQVAAIRAAGLPRGLGARVVRALNRTGEIRAPASVFRELFSDSA